MDRSGPTLLLVLTQEAPALGEIVVHDVEDLSVHARNEPREDDRVGAVVYVGQRHPAGPADAHEDPERVQSEGSGQRLLAGPEDDARTDDRERDPVLVMIGPDDLILLDLAIDIGIEALFEIGFERAGFVPDPVLAQA